MTTKRFRFWCKGKSLNLNFNKTGWWSIPNFTLEKYYNWEELFSGEDFVVCQSIGRRDINNEEIYEGTILQDDNEFIYDVYFDIADQRYMLDRHKEGDTVAQIPLADACVAGMTIIGDIYTRPDLVGLEDGWWKQ